MARPSKYPTELRERAVRMVLESRGDYPSECEVIRSIAGKLGRTAVDRQAADATRHAPNAGEPRLPAFASPRTWQHGGDDQEQEHGAVGNQGSGTHREEHRRVHPDVFSAVRRG